MLIELVVFTLIMIHKNQSITGRLSRLQQDIPQVMVEIIE